MTGQKPVGWRRLFKDSPGPTVPDPLPFPVMIGDAERKVREAVEGREVVMVEQLSVVLTDGEAKTWDEVIAAAAGLRAKLERIRS